MTPPTYCVLSRVRLPMFKESVFATVPEKHLENYFLEFHLDIASCYNQTVVAAK